MNAVNTLFVFSTILVPLLLLSLNYSSINDFYESYPYSASLNSFELSDDWPNTPEEFKRIQNLKDSKCFTTPSMNEFCFDDYTIYRHGTGMSGIFVSNLGFGNSHMHLENVETATFSYFTIRNMTQINENDDAVLITFGGDDGVVGAFVHNSPANFEFTTTLEKFDTFVPTCSNDLGTGIVIMQYLGIETIGGDDYFVISEFGADLEKPIPCDYPEIIQYSLNHDFGI